AGDGAEGVCPFGRRAGAPAPGGGQDQRPAGLFQARRSRSGSSSEKAGPAGAREEAGAEAEAEVARGGLTPPPSTVRPLRYPSSASSVIRIVPLPSPCRSWRFLPAATRA